MFITHTSARVLREKEKCWRRGKKSGGNLWLFGTEAKHTSKENAAASRDGKHHEKAKGQRRGAS
jgi:hypothetical protein